MIGDGVAWHQTHEWGLGSLQFLISATECIDYEEQDGTICLMSQFTGYISRPCKHFPLRFWIGWLRTASPAWIYAVMKS